MAGMRTPFQGVWNIIRFNWHFYVLAFCAMSAMFLFNPYVDKAYQLYSYVLCALILGSVCISLFVSWYIYDFSGLYRLSWLREWEGKDKVTLVNLNAGFDETSELLLHKIQQADLKAFDFYEEAKHTEVSIKRARKAYPPFPGTQAVKTSRIPLEDRSTDLVFAFLSAHEIRQEQERIAFFKELHRVTKTSGQIMVTEHLRDPANFLAYNIGFLHFHSKASWKKTFAAAGLRVEREIKTTPFVTTFILEKYGTAS